MNYENIQDIFDAGVTNMEIIRNNSKNDSGNDILTGVDWFIFNGTIAKTIAVSGNSWVGFGTTDEQLKINRRNTASYYIYREEGTLLDYYKFLKIRWSGYSAYNKTSDAYKLEYDIVLWDTGDISVHMITIPTTNNDGVYSLSSNTTYTYTVSADNPDVTFLYKDGGFTVENNLINLQFPYNRKWLVRAEEQIYTTKNGTLELINEVVSSLVFQTYGSELPPIWEYIQSLTDPEILYWCDTTKYKPRMQVDMKATPHFQSIISDKIDLSNETIKGIESVTVDCDNELIVAVSFDDKQTWKAWSGTEWLELGEQFSGMSKEVLEALTIDQWNQLYVGSSSMYLRVSFVNTSQAIRQIYIDFIN